MRKPYFFSHFALCMATWLVLGSATSYGQRNSPPSSLLYFSNLPQKDRAAFAKGLDEAKKTFNQKRIFDTLEKIKGIEQICPNHPAALNLKGACLVELRDFAKAQHIFEGILKEQPTSLPVLFNLAEMNFVQKKWAAAEKLFHKIIPLINEGIQKDMKRLCELKLLLCYLKTGKTKEANQLANQYDQWDDSPFYYYAKAAIQYTNNDAEAGDKSIKEARFIWKNDALLTPWQDTFIEYGFLKSFYGLQSEDETKQSPSTPLR